jgi:hypothetical protein
MFSLSTRHSRAAAPSSRLPHSRSLLQPFTRFGGLAAIILAFLAFASQGWGQITEGFESGLPASYTATASYTLGSGTWTGAPSLVIKATTPVKTGSASCQLKNTTGANVTTPILNSGVGTIKVWAAASTGTGGLQVQTSTDGTTFNQTGSTATPLQTMTQYTFAVNDATVRYVRFYRTAQTMIIDDVSITLPPPSTQATNVAAGTPTTSTIPTISCTNGNGARRAVFIAAASSGNAAPVDGTTYTANTAFGTGTQIGTTGWYCIYDGTGTPSVTVTGLSASTTYRVMAVEYNGSGATSVFRTATGTANPANFTTAAPPTISTSGTLAAVNTTYGTASASPTSFTVSGSNMSAGITVTPPAGFEVSQTAGGASGYAGSGTAITVGSSGTISSTTVYVRLAATASAGSSPYSGNIALISSGATPVNVATVSSTVTQATPSLLITSNSTAVVGNTVSLTSNSPAASGAVSASTGAISYTSSNTSVSCICC